LDGLLATTSQPSLQPFFNYRFPWLIWAYIWAFLDWFGLILTQTVEELCSFTSQLDIVRMSTLIAPSITGMNISISTRAWIYLYLPNTHINPWTSVSNCYVDYISISTILTNSLKYFGPIR
jgi:hypothetical protein